MAERVIEIIHVSVLLFEPIGIERTRAPWTEFAVNRDRTQATGVFISLGRIKFPAVTIVLRLHATSIVFMVYFVGALSVAVFFRFAFFTSFFRLETSRRVYNRRRPRTRLHCSDKSSFDFKVYTIHTNNLSFTTHAHDCSFRRLDASCGYAKNNFFSRLRSKTPAISSRCPSTKYHVSMSFDWFNGRRNSSGLLNRIRLRWP